MSAFIPTTCLSDAMQGINNMDAAIKPLKGSYRFAGKALTVKMVPGDNLIVLRAIRESCPGDVLVIDAKGDTSRAIAGDFVVGMAKTMGIQAIVVDGAIRDIEGIRQLDFPVFSKGSTVAASHKEGKGELNVPISCGGVSVRPEDFIVGDADGVVVISAELKENIFLNAEEKMKQDEIREAKISNNKQAVLAYLDQMLKSHF
ncbi:RraA family protein [Paenibacillus camerounensis]|uniref:RraA family protein n=1 Tax=Paenibacillus camerounensis TaxID=1243663 RepID=UPI0005A88FBC|nr:RraA family protein [Paenibacillus camerounensis]